MEASILTPMSESTVNSTKGLEIVSGGQGAMATTPSGYKVRLRTGTVSERPSLVTPSGYRVQMTVQTDH